MVLLFLYVCTLRVTHERAQSHHENAPCSSESKEMSKKTFHVIGNMSFLTSDA